MNINTVKLKNISNESIYLECSKEAYLIAPNASLTVFDRTDLESFDIGLRISTECNGNIDELCEKNRMEFIIDDTLIADQNTRNKIYLWVNSMYAPRMLSYFEDYFYFNMKTNEFIITNPLSGKRYSVQLSEYVQK